MALRVHTVRALQFLHKPAVDHLGIKAFERRKRMAKSVVFGGSRYLSRILAASCLMRVVSALIAAATASGAPLS
jgi:hypothetical protein